MIIRAKFRCLSITNKYDGTIIANFAAVKRDGKDTENTVFWKASPNGDAELFYYKECPIEAGSYYYIDMEKKIEACASDLDHPELWKLSRREENDHYVNIGLTWWVTRTDYSKPPPVGLISGSFKVGLSEAADGAKEAFKPVRSRWEVTFTFAEASDTLTA